MLVAGVACWSVPAALICAGLMLMAGAVALAAVQEGHPPKPVLRSNGSVPQHEATVG